jgi:ATP-binding cassette subfamily B multidrug efflux pump
MGRQGGIPAVPQTKRISTYLWANHYWLLFGSLMGIIQNIAGVFPPIYLGKAIDALIQLAKAGSDAAANSSLQTIIFWYALTSIILAASRVGKRYGIRVMTNLINCSLRRDLLSGIFSWSMPKSDQERIGDLMSRAVGDVQQVADSIRMVMVNIFDTGFMILVNLVALFILRPEITIWVILPIPASILLAQAIGPHVFKRAIRVREIASQLNTHLHQAISGVRLFRFLGLELANNRRFDGISRSQAEANVKLVRFQGGVIPMYTAIASLGIIIIITLGGQAVTHGTWSIGGFTGYLTIYIIAAERVLNAAKVINRYQAGKAAWKRVLGKLETAVDFAEPSMDCNRFTGVNGIEVRAENLSFSFPGSSRRVLQDLSLHFPAGSLIGITGPVGSGKTALALALSGLYPYRGSCTLNGLELASLSRAERVAAISYMGQGEFLFSTSIGENIAFLPEQEVDTERLEQVAHWAALSDDLTLFPEGYQTTIGESGVRVSGGQRQRIALTRALYPKSPLLILDDPFSAVDIATEQRIINRMRKAFAARTIVLFSHRLACFPKADHIILLNNGRIEAEGSHALLMQEGGVYARIFTAQQWMEEHDQ